MAAHDQPSSARPRGFSTYDLSAAAFASSRQTHAASRPPPRPVSYVPNRIDDPNYVRISDTTLSVMEKALGAAMSADKKLTIAGQLACLGVDIIEIGSPASSPGNLSTARSIAEEVGNTPVGEDGFVPVICVLSRCIKGDIDKAWEAVQHARRPRINIFIETSETEMERKLRKRPDQVIAIAKEMVAYARNLGCPDVQFSAKDACRSNREFLYTILEEVITVGATTASIVDSAGYTHPDEFENLIVGIKANTCGIENAIVSTHCQNGLGFATVNTLTGAHAGARQLEVTINGIGERVGNASLEEVVMAIKFYGGRVASMYTGINYGDIAMTSKLVNWQSGLNLQLHKSSFGIKSAAHGSGIHNGLPNSAIYDDEANRRKGLLGFVCSLLGIIFLGYTALNTFSLTHPGSQKALVTFDDTETKVMILINHASWLGGSFGLVSYGSHFKDGESIDHIGFDIFIWLLFLWLLLLTGNYCATMHIFLKIPITHVLPVGVAMFCFTVIVSAPYIEHQRPTIVSKWTKYMWKKITGCCLSLANFPRWFRQGEKLSCVWERDISTTESDETAPSSYSMELRSIESGSPASP